MTKTASISDDARISRMGHRSLSPRARDATFLFHGGRRRRAFSRTLTPTTTAAAGEYWMTNGWHLQRLPGRPTRAHCESSRREVLWKFCKCTALTRSPVFSVAWLVLPGIRRERRILAYLSCRRAFRGLFVMGIGLSNSLLGVNIF